MIRVGIAFQVAVNFLLMVEAAGQRRVKLRLREVRQALQNLIRRHAELVNRVYPTLKSKNATA